MPASEPQITPTKGVLPIDPSFRPQTDVALDHARPDRSRIQPDFFPQRMFDLLHSPSGMLANSNCRSGSGRSFCSLIHWITPSGSINTGPRYGAAPTTTPDST